MARLESLFAILSIARSVVARFRAWRMMRLSAVVNLLCLTRFVLDPNGVTSAIEVAAGGALRDIAVSLDITHTYRGDLQVTLTPPAGAAVELKAVDRREGDDNLLQSYTPADTPGLAQLVAQGIDINGRWRLNVSDNLAQDVGKLNSWALRLRT